MAGFNHLTARDIAMLCAVGRVPFLSGPELGALFFGEPAHAGDSRMRRLRLLRRRGLLLCPPRLGSRGPLCFALAAVGREACLADAEMSPEEVALFNKKMLTSPLTHFRLLAHTFTVISLAVAKTAAPDVDNFFGEHFFKHPANFDRLRTAAGRRVPVIPDSLFVLRRTDGKRKFIFIEADTGSEPLGRIIRKIHGYEAYRSPAGSRAFEARFHAPPVFEVNNGEECPQINGLKSPLFSGVAVYCQLAMGTSFSVTGLDLGCPNNPARRFSFSRKLSPLMFRVVE